MNNNIFTKKGRISNYGLSCGYIDNIRHYDYELELYKEHNIFNVRLCKGTNVINRNQFDKLSEARKYFQEQINLYFI